MARIADFHSAEDGSKPSGSANSQRILLAGSFNGRTARFERAYVGSIPTPASMFDSQGLAGEERSLIRIDSRDRHPDLRPFFFSCLRSSMEERRIVSPKNADRNRAQVPTMLPIGA